MGTNSNAESGKVYVKGKAAGKYTCDMVAIKITFYSSSVSASKASEAVMIQCEKFLQRLEEAGIDITMIRLQDDSVDQPSYRDEDHVKATRTLKFDSDAHADINNFILKVIQEALGIPIDQALAPCLNGRLSCGRRACPSRTLYRSVMWFFFCFSLYFLSHNMSNKKYNSIEVVIPQRWLSDF